MRSRALSPSRPALVLAVLLALALLIQPSRADHARCFSDVPADAPGGGDELLRRVPPDVLKAIRDRGYAFPERPVSPMKANDRAGQMRCASQSYALVLFALPRRRVMDLLVQTHRQAEFLPNVKSVTSVMRGDDESVDEHELKVLFTRLTYRIHHHWIESDWHIWWKLDESFDNDIRSLRGYWKLYAMEDGRTLAVYGTQVNVGAVFPKRVQTLLTRKTLRHTIRQFRRWVDSDGSYR